MYLIVRPNFEMSSITVCTSCLKQIKKKDVTKKNVRNIKRMPEAALSHPLLKFQVEH
jgi:ribosomal protein L28